MGSYWSQNEAPIDLAPGITTEIRSTVEPALPANTHLATRREPSEPDIQADGTASADGLSKGKILLSTVKEA